MDCHQLKLNETVQFSGSESYKDGIKVFEDLKGNLPDAILSISDEQAIGIMHSALDLVLEYQKIYKLLASTIHD